MELRTTHYRVLRGLANQTDGLWLSDGCDNIQYSLEADNNCNGMQKRVLAIKWAEQRRQLAEHLYFSHRKSLS
jgi:hypothetical protein